MSANEKTCKTLIKISIPNRVNHTHVECYLNTHGLESILRSWAKPQLGDAGFFKQVLIVATFSVTPEEVGLSGVTITGLCITSMCTRHIGPNKHKPFPPAFELNRQSPPPLFARLVSSDLQKASSTN